MLISFLTQSNSIYHFDTLTLEFYKTNEPKIVCINEYRLPTIGKSFIITYFKNKEIHFIKTSPVKQIISSISNEDDDEIKEFGWAI